MSTTIKEVANRARVSTATVSRVLNNSGPVDDDTRRLVREAARELRYVPNAIGRSLSTRKSDAIGLLLPDLYGEFFSEVIRGADQYAQQNKYHLLVSSSHNNRNEIEDALQMMRGRVDGLIVMSPHIEADTLDENLPRSMPVVLMNCFIENDSFDSLNIDNYSGAYQMVMHLVEHGHKRIAMIKGPERNYDARERWRGYNDAIREGHALAIPSLEMKGNFSEASGYDAVRTLLNQNTKPTAIFAANDSMAIGALSALRDSGIRVPEEIALAGFDDIPIAHYLTPSLTSVHIDISKLGGMAIEKLIHSIRLKNEHKKERVLLPTSVVIRESCGNH
ncbi:MAG: LacI family DNA-binding transcriptional regulator [Ignavibacteriae bacterium]|nr:LacI family DNA-binding transcriptional regulator [Ignavibacteriota bacterium]